ncbi:MAG: hypothetical protein IJR41_04655 [Atopobiaceae bacterium]|nr:hypothetical protein [Atopobiaceae bacterium]
MECECRRVTATISAGRTVEASLSGSSTISGTLSMRGSHAAPYQGAYEVTPSEEAQVLGTAQRLLLEDVVVNPIPSNYGKITWDGSVLTVS